MKKYSPILFLFLFSCVYSQGTKQSTFKKRVLESTEVDFLASYYVQDGSKSSVSGGIGSEKLKDVASNITVAMPLNDDDVLTVDIGISAYSSASSSNINPFNSSGASGSSNYSGASGGDDDDDVGCNSDWRQLCRVVCCDAAGPRPAFGAADRCRRAT